MVDHSDKPVYVATLLTTMSAVARARDSSRQLSKACDDSRRRNCGTRESIKKSDSLISQLSSFWALGDSPRMKDLRQTLVPPKYGH